MNPVSISITGIFALLILAFASLLLVAILKNLKAAQGYRDALGRKLSGLRLSRMLTHRSIDQNRYLHTQPVTDIEQQMKGCGSCSQTDRCDRVMTGGETGVNLDFCVNDEDLRAVKRKLDSVA